MKKSIKKRPRTRATQKQVETRVKRISILINFMNVQEIAELLKIDRTTVYHYLNILNLNKI